MINIALKVQIKVKLLYPIINIALKLQIKLRLSYPNDKHISESTDQGETFTPHDNIALKVQINL